MLREEARLTLNGASVDHAPFVGRDADEGVARIANLVLVLREHWRTVAVRNAAAIDSSGVPRRR